MSAEAEHFRRVRDAFERLADLPAEAVDAELATLRLQDPSLLDEVVAMLAARGDPRLRPAAQPALASDVAAARGYRVLGEIGRGGMGRVLLAERADGRFTRRVALKVLDAAGADPAWRQRFEAERALLGRLVHPGIVRLLDAGEAEDGSPYLVMEYVEGETLDRFIARRTPDLATRLVLFRRIAEAVSYAHRMLVAHRDLKPANVLVDAEGRPHLLDFGIARGLGEAAATATGTRALTPRYAAPEQVAGQPTSAAVDIYQLGLLLYELLAGAPPFAHHTGPALLRAIERDTPPPPAELARRHGLPFARQVNADLDAICAVALRKEPEHRYPSVEALLADLDRYASGEPVHAHRGGAGYRLRKFLRRRWRVLLAAAAMLALSAGFVWSLQRELARTEAERAVAERALDLIVDIVGRADPSRAQGEELTLREALDQSVERLRSQRDVPDVLRARLLQAIGETYIELSQNPAALGLLTEAAQAFARDGDQDGEEMALHARLVALQNLGHYADAQGANESLLALRRARGHEGDALEAELHANLGNLHQYQRRPDAALQAYGQALAVLRALPEPDLPQLAHTLRNLGEIRTSQGDAAGGQAELEEAGVLIRQLYGPDHPDAIRLLRSLGRNAQRRGDNAAALALLEEGWRRAEQVFPAPHDVRILLAHPLAWARHSNGDRAGALALMRQAAHEAEALYPAAHRSRGTVASDLALLLLLGGQRDDARRSAEIALAARRAAEVPDAQVAEAELVLAVLECPQRADAAARARVDAAWERTASADPPPPALAEALREAAALCPEAR